MKSERNVGKCLKLDSLCSTRTVGSITTGRAAGLPCQSLRLSAAYAPPMDRCRTLTTLGLPQRCVTAKLSGGSGRPGGSWADVDEMQHKSMPAVARNESHFGYLYVSMLFRFRGRPCSST